MPFVEHGVVRMSDRSFYSRAPTTVSRRPPLLWKSTSRPYSGRRHTPPREEGGKRRDFNSVNRSPCSFSGFTCDSQALFRNLQPFSRLGTRTHGGHPSLPLSSKNNFLLAEAGVRSLRRGEDTMDAAGRREFRKSAQLRGAARRSAARRGSVRSHGNRKTTILGYSPKAIPRHDGATARGKGVRVWLAVILP